MVKTTPKKIFNKEYIGCAKMKGYIYDMSAPGYMSFSETLTRPLEDGLKSGEILVINLIYD